MGAVERFEAAQQQALAVHGVEAEHRFEQLRSVGRTHILEVGEGPPLLFVIGGGAPGAMWAPLLAELPGYRCIVVDRPGFGLTENIPHRRADLHEVAHRFLADVLDACGHDAVGVVANSMGAWWSTQLALAEPDRVSAMVHIGCPALLLDTSAPLPMRFIGVRGLGRLMLKAQGASDDVSRQSYEMMGDPVDESPSGVAMTELMTATGKLPDYVEAWAGLLGAFIRPRGPRPGMSITPAMLRRLEMPLLYVWGARDPFGDQEVGRRAASIVPDGRYVPVEQGHVPWITDAEDVAAPVRDFLAGEYEQPATPNEVDGMEAREES